ncbi:MAG: homoserine O-succinyltransferase [Oscillospiraceae bacterium]|nr:homoserine O-succinyltransferase [Ruminococcus sp.]MBQ4346243.1 homoserine O-succinyltransferase [Oscillospiraceae bacterium]
MPICISKELPAYQALLNEKIFVMGAEQAAHQDIRPLRILILNIMPKKIETETQLLRLLSNTPLQVDISLLRLESHVSKNTAQSHMDAFYTTFSEIRKKYYDGMIITGAPVEQLPFEEVDYWSEICEIMDWSKRHVFSTLHICWGAQAGLYHHFGVPKYPLEQKMFGIFPHKAEVENSLLLQGFDEVFDVPHSRHTEVRREDIEKVDALEILTSSPLSGVHIVANRNGRQYFITGHSEYDRNTLADEYFRDKEKGLPIAIPYHYFPNDDPACQPRFSWRCHANLMFSNWLNYCVYQRTPFDLEELALRNWNWHMDA